MRIDAGTSKGDVNTSIGESDTDETMSAANDSRNASTDDDDDDVDASVAWLDRPARSPCPSNGRCSASAKLVPHSKASTAGVSLDPPLLWLLSSVDSAMVDSVLRS